MTDKDKEPIDFTDEEEQLADDFCPICGNPMVIEYGLEVCYYCGYSPDGIDEEE